MWHRRETSRNLNLQFRQVVYAAAKVPGGIENVFHRPRQIMSLKAFRGTVENGRIRLPTHVRLPEETTVYVVVPEKEASPGAYVGSPRLAHPEQAPEFEKEVIEEDDASL